MQVSSLRVEGTVKEDKLMPQPCYPLITLELNDPSVSFKRVMPAKYVLAKITQLKFENGY